MRELLLAVSFALAGIYGVLLCDREPSNIRTIVKSSAVWLVALWVAAWSGPWSLIAALGFSAIGDTFLAGNPKRWLLPAVAAFLAAHGLYLTLFLSMETPPTRSATWISLIGLLILAVSWSAFLWRDLGQLRWPVVVYSITIALMGAAATRLSTERWTVMLGAAMFISSDVILSIELFKLSEQSPAKALTSRALWALYFIGQTLIAGGVLTKDALS